MKKIKLKILIISLLTLSVSCSDFLDVVPDDVATIEMAFSNRRNAEYFLYTCYSYMPNLASIQSNPGLAAGDEMWNANDKNHYYENRTTFFVAQGMQNTSSPLVNYWGGGNGGRNLFVGIRDCNTLLENIDNVPDLNPSDRSRWAAEAKVLKAYFHYYLMELYGPVPIIKENIPVHAGIEETKVPREPVDKVVEYIVSLIDEATEDKDFPSPSLPLYIRAEGTEMGRLTLPAALAIKAKVLTLAASPLFNGNPDFKNYKDQNGVNFINPVEDSKKWEKARDALKEAIDYAHRVGHGLYEFDDNLKTSVSDTTLLELTLRNTITSRYNKELIWGLGFWHGEPVGGDYTTNELQGTVNAPLTSYHQGDQIWWTRSMHNPTLKIAEQFYTNNGVPIEEDVNYDYANRFSVQLTPPEHDFYLIKGFRTAYLNFYREPRYYAYLGFDGGKWYTSEVPGDTRSFEVHNKANEVAGKSMNNYNITGYFAKKLVSYKLVMTESQHTGPTLGYPFPIIRLADLYLLYAEALNECKASPDNEVYQYIQLVRNKAGLDKETGSLVNTWATYSSNRDKPKTKNGMRDIIRRERLIELAFEGHRFYDLRRWRLASEYFQQPVRGWNVSEKTEAGYYQVTYLFFRKFTLKDYFWPLSNKDLYDNDKLIQSPYWD